MLGIVVIILAANFPKIQNTYSKMSAQKTKKVSTITKTLTKVEAIHHTYNEVLLVKKYNTRQTEWLYDEIHDGIDSMSPYVAYMENHPEYDSAKFTFTLVKYKVDGKLVEFTTNGKIVQVHSEKGWVDYTPE
ncbi:hypothetical protein HPK19_25090 (plasmid) [Arthrobacter citreus]|nr:hypothetical protein HPK19_25090 [Arthrobacter citreus]